MNNQLFLIIVIVIVLYIIHHMSSNVYVSLTPAPINLPKLEYVLKNVISESRREHFTTDIKSIITSNMTKNDLKYMLDSVNVANVESNLETLDDNQLKILKDKINSFTSDITDSSLFNYKNIIVKIINYEKK